MYGALLNLSEPVDLLIAVLVLLEADFEFLGTFETAPNSDSAWRCIKAATYSQSPASPSSPKANVPSQKPLLAVNNHHHASKVIANNNRQKKHELTDALGLGKGALPYSDLVTKNNLTIIQCDCIPDQYKCGMVLVDHGNGDLARDGEKVLFIPADDMYMVVLSLSSFMAVVPYVLILLTMQMRHHIHEALDTDSEQAGPSHAGPTLASMNAGPETIDLTDGAMDTTPVNDEVSPVLPDALPTTPPLTPTQTMSQPAPSSSFTIDTSLMNPWKGNHTFQF
ncbi:hypothetical protein PISMIDRAFT_24606 [Pisolithus microcarpus 441]|uniref:Uncharacterized protein n=1 Tax=Pisolithus microcarpus 441 TaxID=765257 RepID=A0A0C9YQ12_9AGAM|nr:hypothetical protein BKA83DRAFT_24606 [Pisolithus microcarpus]KIK18711.1 hypothetical protein PISMIDRAFT_24606 [Pisolithus microcarpus 441]